jgi:UDP-glucuronate 4-epimerase
VVHVLDHAPRPDPAWPRENPDPATSYAPYRVFNIGNHQPVPLLDCIAALERALGRTAVLEMLPMQPGDVLSTMAEVRELEKAVGFRPDTPLETGIARFVEWYREFYRVDRPVGTEASTG